MNFGETLFFGALVALANVLGGLILARPGTPIRNTQLLRYLVGGGGGFMGGAFFFYLFRVWV